MCASHVNAQNKTELAATVASSRNQVSTGKIKGKKPTHNPKSKTKDFDSSNRNLHDLNEGKRLKKGHDITTCKAFVI
jgi:hypothetical protein